MLLMPTVSEEPGFHLQKSWWTDKNQKPTILAQEGTTQCEIVAAPLPLLPAVPPSVVCNNCQTSRSPATPGSKEKTTEAAS